MSKSFSTRTGKDFPSYLIEKLPVIIAFLIPVFLLLLLYIGRGIYPFGENMYLRSDMYHQYAPFMKEFQRNIQQGGSLLYAWDIGLGTNFASTYAYYLASPLNWLVGLFPDSLVPEFMNLMIFLKSGLMSALFTWYLIRKFRRNNYIATAFGCFYAMSSYMAAFSWNVMWLDCLVLLPLILMGLEALVRDGKIRMYTITLALSAISNYYITIMTSIFLIFYFIYLLVCESKFRDALHYVGRMCLFAVSSLLAAGMSMFMILPALFHLFITASSNSTFPSSMTAYYNLLEMLAKSVINTDPAVFSGHFPNIYCTMALFFLVPLYCILRKAPVRERVGKTILILFLAFSFMFNIPTYMWHGFHFPNSLPCRYSFIYIFLVLVMGYQAILYIRRFTVREIVISAAMGIGGIFVLQAIYGEDSIKPGNAALGALFVLLYLVIALLFRKYNSRKVLLVIFLLITAGAEIVINTNETGYSVTSRTVYYSDNDSIAALLEQVSDPPFYRVEKVTRRTKNDGTWNNYNSASVFSSTTVSGNSDLYSALGMQGRTNAYSYYGHTPFTQALLGVRYEIADKEQSDPLMTEVAEDNGYYLYRNKYAMSLGFLVKDSIADTEYFSSDPYAFQNSMLEHACDVGSLYLPMDSCSGERILFTAEADGRCLIYTSSDIDSCTVEISRDEEIISQQTFSSLETPQIIDAGDVQAGDSIVMLSTDSDVVNITVYPAIMDYGKYEQAMQRLTAGSMEITEFRDDYVKGSVLAGEGQILFTTIPYDPGWSVYVDGAQSDYTDFRESFIMVNLSAGEHTVEFRYRPRGLNAGLVISPTALILFVLWEIFRSGRMKKQRKNGAKNVEISEKQACQLPENTVK